MKATNAANPTNHTNGNQSWKVGKLEGLDSTQSTNERFAQIRSIRQIRRPDHVPGNLLGPLGGPFGAQAFRFAAESPVLNDQGYESGESCESYEWESELESWTLGSWKVWTRRSRPMNDSPRFVRFDRFVALITFQVTSWDLSGDLSGHRPSVLPRKALF